MEIPNPRRILILSPSSVTLTPLLNTLVPPPAPSSSSSNAPSNPTSTSAFTLTPGPTPTKPPPTAQAQEPEQEQIHRITTPYYTASIPIWTDTITSVREWKEEWLSLPGAADVVSSIGAWVVAFAYPLHKTDLTDIQTLLKTVASVLQHHALNSYDTNIAALFAVALPRGEVSGLRVAEEEWEDMCREAGGWEFIDGSISQSTVKRNEFGETTGLPRLLEALSTADWENGAGDTLSADLDIDLDFEEVDQEDDETLLEGIEDIKDAEGNGMRVPMLPRGTGNKETTQSAGDSTQGEPDKAGRSEGREVGGERDVDEGEEEAGEGEEDDVEALQTLLLKMHAVKDMGVELPVAERRKLARRAVREVMRGV